VSEAGFAAAAPVVGVGVDVVDIDVDADVDADADVDVDVAVVVVAPDAVGAPGDGSQTRSNVVAEPKSHEPPSRESSDHSHLAARATQAD
jgi:hypothetical protein